jgi:hypothetical protein
LHQEVHTLLALIRLQELHLIRLQELHPILPILPLPIDSPFDLIDPKNPLDSPALDSPEQVMLDVAVE